MEPMEIANALEAEFVTDVVEVRTFRDQVTVTVNRDKIGSIARWLHDDPKIEMNFLSDLCAVDYPQSELRFGRPTLSRLVLGRFEHSRHAPAGLDGDPLYVVQNHVSGRDQHQGDDGREDDTEGQ